MMGRFTPPKSNCSVPAASAQWILADESAAGWVVPASPSVVELTVGIPEHAALEVVEVDRGTGLRQMLPNVPRTR